MLFSSIKYQHYKNFFAMLRFPSHKFHLMFFFATNMPVILKCWQIVIEKNSQPSHPNQGIDNVKSLFILVVGLVNMYHKYQTYVCTTLSTSFGRFGMVLVVLIFMCSVSILKKNPHTN